jgi:hypothetical protein
MLSEAVKKKQIITHVNAYEPRKRPNVDAGLIKVKAIDAMLTRRVFAVIAGPGL